MKRKDKNYIIIWFTSSVVIFALFLIVSLVYIYPSILEIEESKNNLNAKIKEKSSLIKEWLSFGDFKKSSIGLKDDSKLWLIINSEYYNKMYSEIDEDFYNDSIFYKWPSNYKDFVKWDNFLKYLDEKSSHLDKYIKWNEFNDKLEELSSILPKYSNYVDLDPNKSLTDLEFISYIENLIYKFSLKTNSSIWVNDLSIVEDDLLWEKTNIYYIPLDLELSWRKLNLLNFLEYIKNTWTIDYVGNDIVFSEENGLNSQLSEVEKLSIYEYIDSSFSIRKNIDISLKDFLLKTGQKNNIIEAKVSLKFYISSIESDRIIKEINDVIWNNVKDYIFDENWEYLKDKKTGEFKYKLIKYNYNNLLSNVQKLASTKELNKDNYYKNKLNKILSYLKSDDLKKDFISINKESNNTENLNSIYLRVMKYKEIFSSIDKEIFSIVEFLWIEKFDKETEDWKIIKWFYSEDYIID